MKFATVCSGIEACSSAWEPLGWEAQFFSEIDPFPCEVLKYHHPTVPNYGDMTQYKEWKDGSVDVICGGTPCQSFSVAGLRKGIESPNGQLMLTFGAILEKYQPRWMVWENVPGVLSSNRGKDFGTFLGMLGELGYGFAYRVLNAEYFGVAQRRRRVFVVGYLGDWKRPASVLFEPESLQGDLAESHKERQRTTGDTKNSVGNCSELPRVTPCITAELKKQVTNQMIGNAESWFIPEYLGNAEGGNLDKPNLTTQNTGGAGISNQTNLVGQKMGTITSRMFNALGARDVEEGALVPQAYTSSSFGQYAEGVGTLRAEGGDIGGGNETIAIQDGFSGQNGRNWNIEKSFTLNSTDKHSVANSMQVRRLTPTECERLQGFEDGHTKIPYRNKSADECPDGPRYKALGNSMAVPVMKWIGERIMRTEKIFNELD